MINLKTRKTGFTLIELLVVIAIIAILAAILFPVFAKVREKARQTMCLSNEKQIGLATLQYVQDYEECYPLGQQVNASTGAGLWDWTIEVQPYIKTGQINGNYSTVRGVFTCPSFPLEPVTGQNEQDQFHPLQNIFNDYGADAAGTPASRPTALNDVDHPADQIMLYEGGLQGPSGGPGPGQGAGAEVGEYCWIGWNNCDSTPSDPAGMNGSGASILSDCDNLTNTAWAALNQWAHVDGEMCGTFPRYRHNGFCNMLFCDGHAKSVRKGALNYTNNIFIPALQAGGAPWGGTI